VKIADLLPGECFEAGEEAPFRAGKLIRLGTGSAVVRYDEDDEKTTTIEVRRGREVVKEVSFTTPSRPVAISLGTTVRRLARPGCQATPTVPVCAVQPEQEVVP
jgi:hypothetical protein